MSDFCSITEEQYLCQSKKLISSLGPLWSNLLENDPKFKAIYETLSKCMYDLNMFNCDTALLCDPCLILELQERIEKRLENSEPLTETELYCGTKTFQLDYQCIIDDWYKVLGLYDCYDLELRTAENLCKLRGLRNLFNCETIRCILEIEGYELLECITDPISPIDDLEPWECISCHSTSLDCNGPNDKCKRYINSCGNCFCAPVIEIEKEPCFGGLGSRLGIISGQCYDIQNTECERKSNSLICSKCCEDDTLSSQTIEPIDPCNFEQLSKCSQNCFGLSNRSCPEYTEKFVCNPWTITILISGDNPCNKRFELGGVSGTKLQGPFTLCALETIKPAHLKIVYKFENETC